MPRVLEKSFSKKIKKFKNFSNFLWKLLFLEKNILKKIKNIEKSEKNV